MTFKKFWTENDPNKGFYRYFIFEFTLTMKKLFLLFVLLFLPALSQAQVGTGLNVQAYPAGIITDAYLDVDLSSNLTLTTGVGYNFTNRRDWGEHDNEEGGGPGFSFKIEKKGFINENLSLILRSDIWFMDIDWINEEPCPSSSSSCGRGEIIQNPGTTEVTVIQPTIGLGYGLSPRENLLIMPTLSFGYEINMETKGEAVGEGAILLLGFKLGYKQ
ncbi:MAG: hypothetical protein ED557_08775 [Balneola sp.]|nr:MAG: hypothetical protein ED557_08775 [Balneola sp.]